MRRIPRTRIAAAVLGLALLAAGCDQTRSAMVEAATGRCQGDRAHAVVELDATKSQASADRHAEQLDLIRSVADSVSRRCGTLRVERFGGSQTDSDVLFDDSLVPDGQTGTARDRNRPALLDRIARIVRGSMDDRTARDGSDPLGALHHAGRVLSQHRGPKLLVVLTDGIQTAAPDVRSTDLTIDGAAALARDVRPPALPGTRVVMAGITRVAGEQHASSYTEALLRFWTDVCAASRATGCLVTDTFAVPADAIR